MGKPRMTDRDAHFKAKYAREAYAKNKITDKERLDWILKRVIPYGDGVIERDPMPQFTHADEIASRRTNIDTAIRSERKGDR